MSRTERVAVVEKRRSWRRFEMKGVVTKRNFFEIARAFGWWKALAVLFSTEQTALSILMK